MCLIPLLGLIHPANDSRLPSDFSAELISLPLSHCSRFLDPGKHIWEVKMAKYPSHCFGWASLSPQINTAPAKQALGMMG